MAVVTATFASGSNLPFDLRDCVVATWANITDSDTCTPIQSGATRRCVQIFGIYGSATIVLAGSNDATTESDGTYITLKDVSDSAISKTTGNVLEQLGELTRWVKPSTSGGTGSNMTVTLYLVK